MSINHSTFKAMIARAATFSPVSPVTGFAGIAWPGAPFTEPSGTTATWVECRLFPAEPTSAGHSGPFAGRRGYLQGTCVTRKRLTALDQVASLADQFAAHFPADAWYADDGIRVQIARRPGPQSMFEEDGKLKIPVIVRYRAFA